MKKELFIESIKALIIQNFEDTSLKDKIAKAFHCDAESIDLQNHLVNNQLIKILQEDMQDTFPSQIEYFCFDCDFGRIKGKYKDASELYDELMRKYNWNCTCKETTGSMTCEVCNICGKPIEESIEQREEFAKQSKADEESLLIK
jgi:hypothetical protein